MGRRQRDKKNKKRKRKGRSLRRDRSSKSAKISQKKVDAFVKDGDYTFWLAHGANYLASPYEEGVWKPLFDLYGKVRKHYSSQEIAATIMTLFRASNPEEMMPEGIPVAAWVQQTPETVYGFYLMARQKVKAEVETREEAEKLIVRPYVDTVWKLFDEQRIRANRAAREHL